MKNNKCRHRRIKKNYPFGRKSRARKYCKDCGAVLKNIDIKEIRRQNSQKRKENKYVKRVKRVKNG